MAPPGTDPAIAAALAAAAHPPLPPREDLPMPAAWRDVPTDATHATPGHVVELVALPALPGVVDHRADHVALPPLAADPQHQPQPVGGATATPGPPPIPPTRRPPSIRPTRPTPCTRGATPYTRPPSTPPTRPTPTPPIPSP